MKTALIILLSLPLAAQVQNLERIQAGAGASSAQMNRILDSLNNAIGVRIPDLSTTAGDFQYRGPSGWTRLAHPGATGHYLCTTSANTAGWCSTPLAPTLAIGAVSTGAPGTAASIVNVGTGNAAILNISIPQGGKGDKGNDGSAATVAVGTVSTGTAAVTNAGTPSAAVLDFVIPAGQKGDTGTPGRDGTSVTIKGTVANTGLLPPSGNTTGDGYLITGHLHVWDGSQWNDVGQIQGPAGNAATVAVGTVATGAAGSSASVANVGNANAAVLNISIPQGAKGDAGTAATVGVGTVTTGAPGAAASVTNVGTPNAALLDITLPQGAQGQPGTAATITVGTVTNSAAGTSPSVINAGTSSAARFNFTIPQGAQGNPGTAATVSVGSVSTGSPGTAAAVANVGTSNAALLNFSIPQGTPGAAGSVSVGQVTTLAPGSLAAVRNTGSSSSAVLNFDLPTGPRGDTGSIAAAESLNITGSMNGRQDYYDLSTGRSAGFQAANGIEANGRLLFPTTLGSPGQALIQSSQTLVTETLEDGSTRPVVLIQLAWATMGTISTTGVDGVANWDAVASVDAIP